MPAPKGNKFAVGHAGTSKKWETPEELQADIDKYFKECESNIMFYRGEEAIREPYTIEGLALTLDCSCATLLNYEKKKGYEVYFATIKKAKLKVQHDKVINMLSGKSTAAGSIFDLKNNHGYKDQQHIDQNNTGDIIVNFKE